MSKTVTSKSLIFSMMTLAILSAGGVGYLVGKQPTPQSSSVAASARTVLYWYDPMVPDKRFDKPEIAFYGYGTGAPLRR